MRIVVDINHPGHVHYFKHFIWEMEKKGHEILITASEKDITFKLLENYHLEFVNIGTYGNSLMSKLIKIPFLNINFYRAVKPFKPDIIIGFGSIRAAHISYLLKKPCINFEDTEHSTEQIKLYLPFVTTVCTPSSYSGNLGKKQIKFDGYMELASLHPNYYTPNPAFLTEQGLKEDDIYTIVRFVSWEASHDVGHHGIQNKVGLVKEIEKYGRVLITSEGELPPELENYKVKVSPDKLHDLLYYASLYIGEGATIASECAVLGTHAIYVNTLRLGYIDEEEKRYGLVYSFSEPQEMDNKVIDKSIELLNDHELRKKGKEKRKKLLEDKVDVTDFMVRLIENYPESVDMVKNK